jgi:hypothetical protein
VPALSSPQHSCPCRMLCLLRRLPQPGLSVWTAPTSKSSSLPIHAVLGKCWGDTTITTLYTSQCQNLLVPTHLQSQALLACQRYQGAPVSSHPSAATPTHHMQRLPLPLHHHGAAGRWHHTVPVLRSHPQVAGMLLVLLPQHQPASVQPARHRQVQISDSTFS